MLCQVRRKLVPRKGQKFHRRRNPYKKGKKVIVKKNTTTENKNVVLKIKNSSKKHVFKDDAYISNEILEPATKRSKIIVGGK